MTPKTHLQQLASLQHPFTRIAGFFWYAPQQALQQVLAKALFFLSHVRPYYSMGHILANIVFLLPCYMLAVVALLKGRLPCAIKLLLVGLFVAQMFIVLLTFADWDGRHLVPVLPVLFILAALGACRTYEYLLGFGILRHSASYSDVQMRK